MLQLLRIMCVAMIMAQYEGYEGECLLNMLMAVDEILVG